MGLTWNNDLVSLLLVDAKPQSGSSKRRRHSDRRTRSRARRLARKELDNACEWCYNGERMDLDYLKQSTLANMSRSATNRLYRFERDE